MAEIQSITMPLLGRKSVLQHQRRLSFLLGLALVVLVAVTLWSLSRSQRVASQLEATGQSLVQSQRLAKAVSQALRGRDPAFADVAQSAGVLVRSVRGLTTGDISIGLSALGGAYRADLEKITPFILQAEKNAAMVLAHQVILTQVGAALHLINRQSADLLERVESVAALKLQQQVSTAEMLVVGRLAMLTQRIAKSANEFRTVEGVSPAAVFLLGKDLTTFSELAQGLLIGNPELRLSPVKDPATREQLLALIQQFEALQLEANA
ncbi:MAG: twitching motility protein PilJ, partial [Rhodoferax sp.]